MNTPESNDQAVCFIGGPLDGQEATPPRNRARWSRYRDALTGAPCDGHHGDAVLRGPLENAPAGRQHGVYILRAQITPTGSVELRYIHSAGHTSGADVWRLIADNLAGTHVGQVVCGHGEPTADAVLRAIASRHLDDMIRLRARLFGPLEQPPAPGRYGPLPAIGRTD